MILSIALVLAVLLALSMLGNVMLVVALGRVGRHLRELIETEGRPRQ